jgi:hypothetical protein
MAFEVGTDDRVALQALERLLLSEDPRHLDDLAALLCCFRDLVVPLLGEALNAECPDIRAAAVWTLARIGGNRARSLLERTAARSDESASVRALASAALTLPPGQLPNPRARSGEPGSSLPSTPGLARSNIDSAGGATRSNRSAGAAVGTRGRQADGSYVLVSAARPTAGRGARAALAGGGTAWAARAREHPCPCYGR